MYGWDACKTSMWNKKPTRRNLKRKRTEKEKKKKRNRIKKGKKKNYVLFPPTSIALQIEEIFFFFIR